MSAVERAVAWTVAGLGGWLGYHLLAQNGKLLLRIEALEERLAQVTGRPVSDDDIPTGLPVGSAYHDFALPTLSGDTVALSDLRGRHVLVIFFDPRCEYSRHLLPDLARLEPDPQDGRPVPLIVSTGDADANRRLMDEHGVRLPVLLQERNEVAKLGWVEGTPMAYLVDERGAVASPLAVGARAILELASSRPSNAPHNGEQALRLGNGYTPYRSMTFRRYDREGPPAGRLAPTFRLPRVDGGELSLSELRGKPVLLVFSDPECQPCRALVPELEAVHRKATDLQVLVVSRGSAEANRRWRDEHGLTFPTVVQQGWEVSHRYRLRATPIAFLIDEAGKIKTDIAVGKDNILALAERGVDDATRRQEVLQGPG